MVDPAFADVVDAFETNFAELGDVGAAVAVSVEGRLVVDLWGGVADVATGRPWAEDTTALVYSTTKGLTAIVALLAWERGNLDVDAPVASVWPEFAVAGKEAITGRQLMSHQAGLAAFTDPVTVADLHPAGAAAARLATQSPAWEPGSAHGYHAISYGWLVDELVFRATGRRVATTFADDVAGPLGLDAWIGLPPAQAHRVATLIEPRLSEPWVGGPPDHRVIALIEGLADPQSVTFRVFANPPMTTADFNSRETQAAGWPATGGIATARALAALYGELARNRVLSRHTLDAASEPQVDGLDLTLRNRTSFGLGFALPSDVITYGPNGGFGHDGAGGSIAFADRSAQLGFAYIPNQMGNALGTDERARRLIDAVYKAI